jgi:mitochondrial fission protein ELM1
MTKTVWVLSDGKKGTENQSIGLAQALGYNNYILKPISVNFPWTLLPPDLWFNPLSAVKKNKDLFPDDNWPDILIAAGRICAAVAAEIRSRAKGKTFVIFIQNPYIQADKFDVVIAPEHDNVKGENVINTFGALHGLTFEKLKQASSRHNNLIEDLPNPRVAVLIGGKNKHYKMAPSLMEQYGSQLRHIAKRKTVSYMVTGSRRTPIQCLQAFKRGLGSAPAFIWNGRGDNPYHAFLSAADIIMVTADSVSMISEAIYTNKPVYILELEGKSSRLDNFIESAYKKKYARPFKKDIETWRYKPLDTMQQVLDALKKYLPK